MIQAVMKMVYATQLFSNVYVMKIFEDNIVNFNNKINKFFNKN